MQDTESPPPRRATASMEEFAATYGIARSTAYDLAKRNALPVPVIRLGRRLVVSRELMERVLAGEVVERRAPRDQEGA